MPAAYATAPTMPAPPRRPPDAASWSSAARHPPFMALTLSFIVLLAALAIACSISDRNNVLTEATESARRLSGRTALAAEGILDTTRQLLYSMEILVRTAPRTGPGDGAAIARQLLWWKTRHSQIMDLLVLDSRGKVIHWTSPGPPPGVADRDYFTAHMGKTRSPLFVSAPQTSRVHPGRMFVGLSEAIRDIDGSLTGVLVVLFDRDLLSERLGIRPFTRGNAFALLGLQGDVFAGTANAATLAEPLAGILNSPARQAGAETPVVTLPGGGPERRQRLVSFRRLAHFPLIAAGAVEPDEALTPWRQRTAILFSAWLLFATFTLWLARRATRACQNQTRLEAIDTLTGLTNRHSLLAAASELEDAQTDAGSLSAILVDIDDLKIINERYGEAVGDRVLRTVAEAIRGRAGRQGLLGRYGDDEFLILAVGADNETLLALAEDIRLAVASLPGEPALRVSIGVAGAHALDPSFHHVLSRAANARHTARNAGGNCVRFV